MNKWIFHVIGLHQYCKKIKLYPATQLEASVVFGLFLSLFFLFVYYPNIDLRVAHFFYDSEGSVFNNDWLTLIKHMISWFAVGLTFGLFLMMQGGHFLSDVLFSFFPIWVAMALVIRLFWGYHLLGDYFMKSTIFRKLRNNMD